MLKRTALAAFLFILIAGCAQQQSPTALWKQGMEFTEQEKYDQALDSFKKLVNTESLSDTLEAKANFTLADLYLNHFKKYQDALKYYRFVAENYSATKWGPKSQFMIGYMFANYINDYKKARQEYQHFLDIYPTDDLAEAVNFEISHLGKSLDDLDFIPSADSLGGMQSMNTGGQDK